MSVNQPKSGPSLAVVIVIGSALLLALAGVAIALTISLFSAPGTTPQTGDESDDETPTRTEIVLDASWADGSDLSDDELGELEDLITSRLERAGVTATDVSADGTQVRVTLDEETDEETLDAAVESLDREFILEFRPILDVGICSSVDDHTDYGPDEEVIFCDLERFAAYELGANEVTGSTMIGATTYELDNGDWGVRILFGPDGAAQLAVLTARLVGNEGVTDGVGISVGGEVLSSAEVTEVIQDGSVSITGSLDKAKAEAMASTLRAAARGLTLSVDSATLAD